VDTERIRRTRELARTQRGLFTIEQARAVGWSDRSLHRWLAAGVFEEPVPRVYRFAGAQLGWKDRLLATVLSAEGVAARRSAAALFRLLPPPPEPHVVVVRTRRNLVRTRLHSSKDLPASDVTRVGEIPSTTPIRTLIDVASELRAPAVERLVDRAVSRQLVRVFALERRARELRAPGRPGASRVLLALASAHPDLERIRSEFEGTVLRWVRSAGLPDPVPNHPVVTGGRRRILDVAWPAEMVCIEFDGYLPHVEHRDVFDDDRARQNDLVDDGWRVFRLTSRMLDGKARRHFAAVARALRRKESHDPAISA
jgi:hypothetical protein